MPEGEPTAPFVRLVPKLCTIEPFGDPVLQVDPNAAFNDPDVVLLRLFQSQAQAGSASIETVYVNPESDRFRLSLQPPADLRRGLRGDGDHAAAPPSSD